MDREEAHVTKVLELICKCAVRFKPPGCPITDPAQPPPSPCVLPVRILTHRQRNRQQTIPASATTGSSRMRKIVNSVDVTQRKLTVVTIKL